MEEVLSLLIASRKHEKERPIGFFQRRAEVCVLSAFCSVTVCYGSDAAFCDPTVFIHPSEDPHVIAGHGSLCLEMWEQMKNENATLDAVIMPVGGGGLASGNIVAFRELYGDKIKIILAEPSEMDDAKRSFESGNLQKHTEGNPLSSVADGLKTTLGPNTWPIIRDMADDIITVSEREILEATKLTWEKLKVCVEPSGAVPLAVALSDAFRSKYPADRGFTNVGIVVSGGNSDILKIAAKMQEAAL